jgi:glycosyltransferase involved in cell wall biosynthesis
MNAQPKITVITPSFQQGAFIEATILSVLQQDYPNLEFLIFDGGSTDSTRSILEQYSGRIDFWESKPDKGQTDALQKGLERASGDWVCYLNSDDVFYPGALHRAAELMTSENNWIAGSIAYIDVHGNETGTREPVWHPGHPEGWITYKNAIGQMAVFVRREALLACGGFDRDYRRAMDTELWLRLELSGFRPVLVTDVLAGFRFHSASKTFGGRLPFLREQRQMLHKHWNALSPSARVGAERVVNRLEAAEYVYAAAGSTGKEVFPSLKKAFEIDRNVLFTRYFWGALRKAFF